jgi:hypothetical protein
MVGKKFGAKNWSNGVDCPPSSVILPVLLKAGLLLLWSVFYVHLGLQIGSILSRQTKTETRDGGQAVFFVGTRLSFFVTKCDEHLVL